MAQLERMDGWNAAAVCMSEESVQMVSWRCFESMVCRHGRSHVDGLRLGSSVLVGVAFALWSHGERGA